MVSTANVLAITNCTTNEIIAPPDFTNIFMAQVQGWLTANPTIRPQYVILFQDLPSRSSYYTGGGQPDEQPSVQYQLNQWCVTNWHPFVTAINMNGTGGTNDCIAYINKLKNMAVNNPPGTLFISAMAADYGNTNWYFDTGDNWGFGTDAEQGVLIVDPSASIYGAVNPSYTAQATNVAGYYTCGVDCNDSFSAGTATNGVIHFFGNSGWYIMSTVDSFNGERIALSNTNQWSYLTWFASDAFGGANYLCTPVGAVVHVDEPFPTGEEYRYIYFGDWAAGRSFVLCAWDSLLGNPFGLCVECAVVGDPFTMK